MVFLVSIVIHDVAVDGGGAIVKHVDRLTLKIGEVIIHVAVVDAVERLVVARAERVEHHVFPGVFVVDGFRSPNADHVAPFLRIFSREIHGGVGPVDEVGGFHQHHSAVRTPAQARLHVGHNHVEGLAVLTAQDVWVANASGEGDGVALDHWHAVVQRSEIITVVTQGVANLLFLWCITREIGEKVTHHFFCLSPCAAHHAEQGC